MSILRNMEPLNKIKSKTTMFTYRLLQNIFHNTMMMTRVSNIVLQQAKKIWLTLSCEFSPLEIFHMKCPYQVKLI